MYYWFYSQQGPEGLVLAENKDNFTVEEEAMAVMVFLKRGHVHRAERILDYFAAMHRELSGQKQFNGFYKYYQVNGEPLSAEILSSTQMWVLLAINKFTEETGNKKYLPMARSLSKIVLDMEGVEKGIGAGFWGETPLSYYTSSDNLLALSVFPQLWKWTHFKEYRFAAWDTYRFAKKFLWSEKAKNFKRRIYQEDFEVTDSYWTTLILGTDYMGWRTLDRPTDFYNQILLALVYAEYKEIIKSRIILAEVERNMIWSKAHLGASGIPVISDGREIDIFTTAWYLLAAEQVNPFAAEADFWENKVIVPPSERQFSEEGFEYGRLQLLLTYPAALIKENQCQIRISKETEDAKSGEAMLRIYFSPVPQAKKVKAVVSRRFLERQDLSSFSNMKIWLKATTSTRLFQSKLQVKVGFVDSDGELWLSPNLSVIGRKGFINSFAFPAGWQRDPDFKANNIFDTEGIQEMKFVITQPEDTPWEIFIDDIKLQ
jgi:hypothetical protein